MQSVAAGGLRQAAPAIVPTAANERIIIERGAFVKMIFFYASAMQSLVCVIVKGCHSTPSSDMAGPLLSPPRARRRSRVGLRLRPRCPGCR